MPSTTPAPRKPAPDHGGAKLLTVAEIAQTTGLTARAARHIVDSRMIPVVKLSNRAYVWSDDLCDWLDSNTMPARTGEARR